MSVNGNISDLFFNTDLSNANLTDKDGQFIDFDLSQLRAEAHDLLACLSRLGVAVPTVEELVTDFLERV